MDSGGRPKGTPGSRLMSTTGPGKPSSRTVAAALPPARPPPTITIGFRLVRSAMRYILPPEPRRGQWEGKLGRLATIDGAGMPHVVPLGWRYNPELGARPGVLAVPEAR